MFIFDISHSGPERATGYTVFYVQILGTSSCRKTREVLYFVTPDRPWCLSWRSCPTWAAIPTCSPSWGPSPTTSTLVSHLGTRHFSAPPRHQKLVAISVFPSLPLLLYLLPSEHWRGDNGTGTSIVLERQSFRQSGNTKDPLLTRSRGKNDTRAQLWQLEITCYQFNECMNNT